MRRMTPKPGGGPLGPGPNDPVRTAPALLRWSRRVANDAGVTMAELAVSMLITSVIAAGTIATTIMVQKTTATTQTLSDENADLRATINEMGRSAIAAAAFTTPGVVNGAAYLEFGTDATAAGVDAYCTQWRYRPAAGVVDKRTALPGGGSPGPWQTLATGVTNQITAPPFTIAGPGVGQALSMIRLDISVAKAGASTRASGDFALPSRVTPTSASPTASATTSTATPAPVSCTGMARS